MDPSWKQREQGYPQFSAFIAADEDKSTTIYRRFERLAARNLLYLESELAELEAKQDMLDAESLADQDMIAATWNLQQLGKLVPKRSDRNERGETKTRLKPVGESAGENMGPRTSDNKPTPVDPILPTVATSPDVMSDAQRDLELRKKVIARLEVAVNIRKALREYYEALKLESDILALNGPSHRVLNDVRKQCQGLQRNRGGAWYQARKSLFYDSPMKDRLRDEKDLCVLAPPVERDRLTKFLEGPFSFFFRNSGDDGDGDFISHKKVEATVSIISTLTALLFLLGALWGLYAVSDAAAQMLMLSAFTVSFGGALGLLTNARRQDVFAATAAYAAVLVVFISTNMASTWGTAPAPAQMAVTVTVLGAGTNTSSLNLTATTMVPSTDQSAGPSIHSSSSTIGVSIAFVFAAGTIFIALFVMTWKIWHRYKPVKEYVPNVTIHMPSGP